MLWLTVVLLAIALLNRGQGQELEMEQGQEQKQGEQGQGQGQDLSGCCTYLRVDTEGLAREHQGNRMGLYRLTGVLNDRPIYKNEEKEEFLFYLQSKAKGLWMVGPEAGQFNGGLAHRGDSYCAEEVNPAQWKYTDGSAWHIDTGLRVTCLDLAVTPQCMYNDQTDFIGGDLPEIFGGGGFETDNGSSAECIEECEKRTGCKYWTYVMEEKVNCFLKSGQGESVRKAKHVSGSISQACGSSSPAPPASFFDPCTHNDTELKGGEIISLSLASAPECRSLCASQKSCRLFSYAAEAANCSLHTDQAGVREREGSVTGGTAVTCQDFTDPQAITCEEKEPECVYSDQTDFEGGDLPEGRASLAARRCQMGSRGDDLEDCVCGRVNRADHDTTVGGVRVEQNEYPWQVLVEPLFDSSPSQLCGGTLLDSLTVLSAAHCFFNKTTNTKASGVRITLGEHDRKHLTGKEIYDGVPITSVILHPGYSISWGDDDISMIFLSFPVSWSDHPKIRPACLPSEEATKEKYVDRYAVATGWGKMYVDAPTAVDVLREVPVLVKSQQNCKDSYKNHRLGQIIHDGILCAGEAGRDTCQGDSGGPLVVRDTHGQYEVIGVTKGGKGCGDLGFPGLYSSTVHYRTWILQQRAAWVQPDYEEYEYEEEEEEEEEDSKAIHGGYRACCMRCWWNPQKKRCLSLNMGKPCPC